MRQSSGFAMVGVEGMSGSDDGPEHVDATAREGDGRLMMTFYLAPFALVDGDRLRSNSVAVRLAETENRSQQTGNPGNVS